MTTSQNGGKAIPDTSPREYLIRVVDPAGDHFAAIDQMHEGQRRHPRTVEEKSGDWRLWQLLEHKDYQGKPVTYTYDFGDNWEHHLTIEGRGDATDRFVCLSGTGQPVAEDVGSVQGWEELKAAYCAQQPTEAQRERRAWYENKASNGDPNGLAGDRVSGWDMDQVNRDLADLFGWFERLADRNIEAQRTSLRERVMAQSEQDIRRM